MVNRQRAVVLDCVRSCHLSFCVRFCIEFERRWCAFVVTFAGGDGFYDGRMRWEAAAMDDLESSSVPGPSVHGSNSGTLAAIGFDVWVSDVVS